MRLGLSSLGLPFLDLLLAAAALGFAASFLVLAFLDAGFLPPKKDLASILGPLFWAGRDDASEPPPKLPLLENEVSTSGSTWPRFVATACLQPMAAQLLAANDDDDDDAIGEHHRKSTTAAGVVFSGSIAWEAAHLTDLCAPLGAACGSARVARSSAYVCMCVCVYVCARACVCVWDRATYVTSTPALRMAASTV